MLDEKRALFKFVRQPKMLASILDREEPDPDMEDFINIQDQDERFKTVIHVATDKRCYASLSILLKAGSYQLKLDGAGLLPDLESLFNHADAAKITDSHVRGLLQKTKMKVLKPEFCWKILMQEDGFGKGRGGKTLLSRLKLSTATMSEIVRVPANGLKFSIVNTEVPAALLDWYKAESAGKRAEKEAADVRKLLEKKGVVVRESSEETELMPSVLSWNDKNKQLCKYSNLFCLFHMRYICHNNQVYKLDDTF